MDFKKFCFFTIQETPCDLVTGEERQYARGAESPADHIACTVEMTRISVPCESQ